ncbi:MAG: LysM peptidoglycan-binding domain-containing protein, partial [Ruminococcaceae bacterium]|nr:LysM peptidoglycan-binding domain-containing protein [Oscillospiraceae bacterium]
SNIETDDTPEESFGMVIYFVQKGDTLWDIAKHYKTDCDRIVVLNKLENELLTPGQKILIPRPIHS